MAVDGIRRARDYGSYEFAMASQCASRSRAAARALRSRPPSVPPRPRQEGSMPHVRERDPNPDELPQDTAKKTGAADPDSSSASDQPTDANVETDAASL